MKQQKRKRKQQKREKEAAAAAAAARAAAAANCTIDMERLNDDARITALATKMAAAKAPNRAATLNANPREQDVVNWDISCLCSYVPCVFVIGIEDV